MQTGVQLFRYDRKLTACALGEPSLTLVRNDTQFGLLLSGGAHEDSLARFYLDNVSYLRVSGQDWTYTPFDSVVLFHHEGVWFAQDTASGRYFPKPSHRAYHVIFISHEEYARLKYARAEGLGFPVFKSAQKHFGRLPGFSFRAKSLNAPDDYADAGHIVPASEYVLTAATA